MAGPLRSTLCATPYLLALLLWAASCVALATAVPAARFDQLVALALSEQAQADTAYYPEGVFPPQQWERIRGLYKSTINFNAPLAPLLQAVNIPDSNSFTSYNVMWNLLEVRLICEGLATTPAAPSKAAAAAAPLCEAAARRITDEVMLPAMESSEQFIDPRPAYQYPQRDEIGRAPIIGFWRWKKYEDPVTKRPVYMQRTSNPMNAFDFGHGILSKAASVPILGYIADVADSALTDLEGAFAISPDTDTTGCAQGVLQQLVRLKGPLPKAAARAADVFGDPKGGLLKEYARYAYRPASKKLDENLIDPRSYFWLHGYLQTAATGANATGGGPVIATTWLQALSETPRQSPWVKTPLQGPGRGEALA